MGKRQQSGGAGCVYKYVGVTTTAERPAERPAEPAVERPRPDSLPLRMVDLFVLCTFAFAQPVLAELDAPFFIAIDIEGLDVLVVVLLLVVVPPLVLLLVELIAKGVGGDTALRGAHLAIVALLLTAIASGIALRLVGDRSKVHVGLALLGGAAATIAYARFAPARSLVRVLAPAPIVFVLLFLFTTPVKAVLFPNSNPPLQGTSATAPVVVLILDEVPGTTLMNSHGRIDGGRYPNFARLAGDATWFRNATTVHAYTNFSIPAILSGVRTEPGGATTPADHPQSLFTLLGRTHRYQVSEPYTDLCPAELCPEPAKPVPQRYVPAIRDMVQVSFELVLPTAIQRRLPEFDVSPFQRTERPLDVVIRSIRNTGRPTLHVAHTQVPHRPFDRLPSGERFPFATDNNAAEVFLDQWDDNAWLVEQEHQRQLLQMGYVDRQLGRLIDRLKRIGLYDRAAIVVISDHGSSFRAGRPRRMATRENLADLMFVPFFLKAPDQRQGIVRDDPVQTTDMLPTLAAALGTRVPWRTDGRNVLDEPARRSRLAITNKTGEPISVDFRTLAERQRTLLRDNARRFGEGSMKTVFGAGPHPELLGRRAPKPAPGEPEYRIDEGEKELRSYDPGSVSEVFPGRVAGHLLGRPGTDRVALAVSLNGRIRATTWTYESFRKPYFSAMLPPDTVRPGANEVAVLEVGPGGRLRPLRR